MSEIAEAGVLFSSELLKIIARDCVSLPSAP